MGRVFSYVVEHDQGFAPNPYGGICTLAYCKPLIRVAANVGDYVIGTGATSEGLQYSMVYWMQVAEIIHFDQYWNDVRFRSKRPQLNGSRILRYGDNIYHFGENGEIIQEDSFHSEVGGRVSLPNLNRDVGRTPKILIGTDFLYLGSQALEIPDELRFAIKKGQGHKCRFSEPQKVALVDWLHSNPVRGFMANPSKWRALRIEEVKSV